MREIEVKAKVKNEETLLSALKNAGCELGSPVVQKDTVYVENTGNLETFLSNRCFMRIRESDDGSIHFTYKRPKSNRLHKEDSLDKVEHELIVDSKEACEGMLEELGFKKAVYTEKTRRKAKWKDYEICFDQIEGLGSFIEIEKMAGENETAEDVESELLGHLISFGIDSQERITQGYDILTILNEQK